MTKYAQLDSTQSPPLVVGYYDTDMHNYPNLPTNLVELSDADWAKRLTENTWTITNGALVAIPPPPPTVAQAVAALGAMQQTKENLGVYFTPTGATSAVLFPTNADAQVKYTAEWNAIGASPALRNDGDPMIAADGTPVALSNADAKALIQKALAYFRACTANYATLHAAVVANPTADITVNWPTNT
jgi:hypothetical protein